MSLAFCKLLGHLSAPSKARQLEASEFQGLWITNPDVILRAR